jgi:N-acetylmuramic acid 6-phosphate etherase
MDHLQTEGRNPASTNLDELSPLQIVQLMNGEDARVNRAIASQAEAIAWGITIIAERLRAGGRLIYVGAGTSGRLGVLDATECPPTFNSNPGQVVGLIAGGPEALTRAVEGAEDHPDYAERDLASLQLGSPDVLVGIATSGRTPYVLGAAAYARRVGAFTIGLACNLDSELEALVDLAITPVVGPEVLSGSTRLKAGTATKLVLNMLSTGAMIRLGKTYGNLMVDLRATNSKLRARTNRIVRLLTGLSVEASAELLARCGQELKTALVAQLAQLSPEEARARLAAMGGDVRQAVASSSAPSTPPSAPAPIRGLVLGIDGGGTHTVALLATVTGATSSSGSSWSILGRGQAGPSNLQAIGAARAMAALDESVIGAFAAAGLRRQPVAAACLGLAGAGRPRDQAVFREWAQSVNLANDLTITTDARLLLAAGTPDGCGVAVVAGTGSIAYARLPDGRDARAGGWGYLLGDEGSAYAIVIQALRAVTRAADGRDGPTALTELFLAKMGLGQPQDLIPLIYRGGWDRTALAGLAPLVLEACDGGDSVAASIVNEAAAALADLAMTAIRKLDWNEPAVPVALSGGVLLASSTYRERVLSAMRAMGIRAEPVCRVDEPAAGAIRLAICCLCSKEDA